MRGNTQRVGWAPTLGECSADGPTEDAMLDVQQVNCARSPMSQLIIADTSMLAVAALRGMVCESGNEEKVGLVS